MFLAFSKCKYFKCNKKSSINLALFLMYRNNFFGTFEWSYLLCSTEEINEYRFGTTKGWVIGFIIFGWAIPSSGSSWQHQQEFQRQQNTFGLKTLRFHTDDLEGEKVEGKQGKWRDRLGRSKGIYSLWGRHCRLSGCPFVGLLLLWFIL